MSNDYLGLLLQVSLFLGVAYAAFVLLGEYNDAKQELKDKQMDRGQDALAELYINLSPKSFFFLRVALASLAFIVFLLLLGVIPAAVFSAVAFFLPLLLLKRLRAKRVKKVETQLVEGLELLGNGLKSGLTLQQAIELLVREFPPPISQEFTLVLAETRLGVEFPEALERMAQRLDSSVVYILSSGVSITKQCGGDITQIFSNLAQTIREQANIEGKLDAVTAQGRFQGLILGLMPFALLVVLYFIDPGHVETLFSYQIGLWAFFGVVLMIGCALLWIRKLLAIDV